MAFSDLRDRFRHIGANQTTGQARVPVIITSAYDDTVGTTVNGFQMNQLIPGNTKAPSAGDGGVIYFGGNRRTSTTRTDPRYGSIIDNANISYITRVEQQGGGIIYTFNTGGAAGFDPSMETLRSRSVRPPGRPRSTTPRRPRANSAWRRSRSELQ